MRKLPLHLLLAAILLTVAAIQARYGNPELFGDDISYLDIAQAIHAGDWHTALSPYWSLGYPLLLSAIRPAFPATASGVMLAGATLHLLVFAASWLSLLLFLASANDFLRRDQPTRTRSLPPALLIAAAAIFLTVETCFGSISTFGPDEIVGCCFFLASALLLRFLAARTTANAALLGFALGIGYVAKVIFLPLSILFIACALLPNRRRLSARTAFAAPVAVLLILLPYAAAISWVMGRPTLGESGALNYAWSVNHLPHWMGWQGGPPALGYPIHPVNLLREHPAVFGFAEPFHTTYPPQFNLEYWYDGYRHFFSIANAIHAVLINLHALEVIYRENLFFTLGVLCAAALLLFRNPARLSLRGIWPIWLPSALAILLYLQVTLESRYLLGFTAILALVPFLLAHTSRLRRNAALALLLAGSSFNLFHRLHEPLRLALHYAPVETTPQWRIAHSLAAQGLRPGDRVASVTTLNDIRCTWAWAAGLHIVAHIGNDAFDPQLQQQDFALFWSDPAIQQDVLRLFREQGALAVIAPSLPANLPAAQPNWHSIPNTNAWLLRIP